jgi:hypothetical protein
MSTTLRWMSVGILCCTAVVFAPACGRNDAAGVTDPGVDGGFVCSQNPQTHEELLNACTDAEAIDKQPSLPLLNADGSLPPLP